MAFYSTSLGKVQAIIMDLARRGNATSSTTERLLGDELVDDVALLAGRGGGGGGEAAEAGGADGEGAEAAVL